MKIMAFFSFTLLSTLFSLQSIAGDIEVKITKDMSHSSVQHGAENVMVQRIQDTDNVIENSYAKTSRPCPPFCVNPIIIAEGVNTVAELEVIKFMESDHADGTGVIIDTRDPERYNHETIPGSINVPSSMISQPKVTPELVELMESFGAHERTGVGAIQRAIESLGFFDGDMKTDDWDFTQAKNLLLWCDGPWCEQLPQSVHALIALGYPAAKIQYYRGGMQMWKSLGLTTVVPANTNRLASNN